MKILLDCQSVTFFILTSACVNALNALNVQQHTNLLYSGYSPNQYRSNQEDSRLNIYSVNNLMKPAPLPPSYNIGYYALTPHSTTPASLPSANPSPIRYQISPFSKYANAFLPEYANRMQEYSNQWPEQLQTQKEQEQNLNYQQQRYQIDQHRHIAPQIIQQQQNEGNFYRQLNELQKPNSTIPPTAAAAAQRKNELEYNQQLDRHKQLEQSQQLQQYQQLQQLLQNSRYSGQNTRYTAFENKVFHVTTPMTPVYQQNYRKRRSFSSKKLINKTNTAPHIQFSTKNTTNGRNNNETKAFNEGFNAPTQQQQKSRYFHDIFMHYAGPQSIAYGHVDRQPQRFTQRFESLNKGNRYRGEVTWADSKTGGYGSQHWDLVQGKL